MFCKKGIIQEHTEEMKTADLVLFSLSVSSRPLGLSMCSNGSVYSKRKEFAQEEYILS